MVNTLITTVLAVVAMLMAGCGLLASGDYKTSVRWWAGAFAVKTVETMIVRYQLKQLRLTNPTR